MKPVTRQVKGHALVGEGAPHTKLGERTRASVAAAFTSSGHGYAKCQCGQMSQEPLETANARKRWHRDHKAEVVERLQKEWKDA